MRTAKSQKKTLRLVTEILLALSILYNDQVVDLHKLQMLAWREFIILRASAAPFSDCGFSHLNKCACRRNSECDIFPSHSIDRKHIKTKYIYKNQ